jgi:hypothetical protein
LLVQLGQLSFHLPDLKLNTPADLVEPWQLGLAVGYTLAQAV